MDSNLTDKDVRAEIFSTIGYDHLMLAVKEVGALIQPPDNVFYQELEQKERTVKKFLPALLRTLNFDSNQAGKPVVEALSWLKARAKKEAPMVVVSKVWKRYVVDKENKVDQTAYTFCVLDKLEGALKRRDVFVQPSLRYCDPRANFHEGKEWEAIRPMICRTLSLTTEPHDHLESLAKELDDAYRLVTANIDTNPFVRFDLIKGNEELILTQLDKLDDPASLKLLRSQIKSRLPRVDLPEVLLEME